MEKSQELLSSLLRETESQVGTNDMVHLSLYSLIKSIKHMDIKNPDEFYPQFVRLLNAVSSTEPKYGILNYHFESLAKYIKNTICKKEKCRKNWRLSVIKRIQSLIKLEREQKSLILKAAEKVNVEGKTILIHDHSHTVQSVLRHYKHLGKKFRVVIAEQDYEKTHYVIEKIHALRIPFQVVPSYMLSHIHDQVDMLFFGAVTLKSTMNFVMDPGTHSVITEFHVVKKPVYMFIDTYKFSLWEAKRKVGVFMHKHTRSHYSKEIEYERIKYSHDRVPADLFSKIVTNEGIFTPNSLKTLFEKKQKSIM